MPFNEEIISFREYTSADEPFIFATWLKGLYFGNSWFKAIDKACYLLAYRKIIQNILFHKGTEVKIACLKEDPEIIIGYSIFEGHILHWVHVKKEFRGLGIAKRLVPKDTLICTHITKIGLLIKPKKIIFNPFYQGE